MIISQSRRFVFVHVHKAGGTSLEAAIAPHLDWSDLLLGTTPLGAAMSEPFRDRYGLYDHASVDEIAAVCGRELFADFYSFALVRHPVDRIVSLYNFLDGLAAFWCRERRAPIGVLRDRALGKPEQLSAETPWTAWSCGRAYLATSGFPEFIRDPRAQADSAFFPQVERLRSLDGAVTVADWFRLEDRDAWLPALSARLGMPLVLGHLNRAATRAVAPGAVAAADADYLRQLFEADFLAFEYRRA